MGGTKNLSGNQQHDKPLRFPFCGTPTSICLGQRSTQHHRCRKTPKVRPRATMDQTAE